MKPAPFRYERPGSLEEALTLLLEEDAHPLAGGLSLVPLMNLRLARPAHLVDLNGLRELTGREVRAEAVRLGALTRHADVIDDPALGEVLPLLPAAARHIGHRFVRRRGTLGGSLAHADPAAEWPLVALATGATLHLVHRDGRREVPAEAFFTGPFLTVLRPGELIEAVSFPRLPGARYAFAEWSRRQGDFAVVAVAAVRTADEVRLAFSGVAPRPTLLRLPAGEVERLTAAVAAFQPDGDLNGSPVFRRRLARVLAQQVWQEVGA